MTAPDRRQAGAEGKPRPLVLGLMGGVAAGKSTVANELAARGFVVLDADREARAAMAEAAVQAAIRARFGDHLYAQGQLDRAALAAIVFRDPAAKAALEAIVHPVVHERLRAGLAKAAAAGRDAVLDVPLLLESGWLPSCDACWFVAASHATRLARARARGWDEGELARREANQTDLEVKRKLCSSIISTDGSLANVGQQIDAALAALRAGR